MKVELPVIFLIKTKTVKHYKVGVARAGAGAGEGRAGSVARR